MNRQHRLLILSKHSARYAELIKGFDFKNLQVAAFDLPDKARKQIKQCDIILGEPPQIASILDTAEKLKWVQSTWAGVDALATLPKRTDYILTGVKGVHDPLINEYVFGYILALERNIFRIYADQKNRLWKNIPYQSLKDRSLGICGLGSIGRHIAQTGKFLGMKVWGYKSRPEKVRGVDRVFTPPKFKAFLAASDYVVITLPITAATHYLFDDDAFAVMNDSAVLINVGRGSIVSERALIRALDEKEIQGAVLDVFEEEPLPRESPLWNHPKVIVTPHVAALSFPEDIVKIFAENYRRFIEGKDLLHSVDFGKGY